MLAQGNWMTSPPGSMFFILFLSLLVAIASTILTKLLVDTAELQRKQKQIKAHQEEKKRIIGLAEIDVERYQKARKKWERRDDMLKKTQQGMAMQRLKPTCVTFLPMMIIFIILNTMVYKGGPVAIAPMGRSLANIPFTDMMFVNRKYWIAHSATITFTGWYFVCSLGINTLLQRIFKLQTQASGGMEQMFGGQKSASAVFPDV